MLNIEGVLRLYTEIADRLHITALEEDADTISLHFILMEGLVTVTGYRRFHKTDRPELFADTADFLFCLWCSPTLTEFPSGSP